MISNSKIKANNGSVTDAAGSAPPNGSNETVTLCRFAIAKAMMMTASGTRTTAATILFSKWTSAGRIVRIRPGSSSD